MDAFIASVVPPPVSEDEIPSAWDDCFCDVNGSRTLKMDSASCYLPHSDHDAHFGVADPGVIGVADGVGAYNTKGVDAGTFSWSLMASAHQHALETTPRPICPYTLLQRAYERTASSDVQGASTVVLVLLVGDTLRWANVGTAASPCSAAVQSCTACGRSWPASTVRSSSSPRAPTASPKWRWARPQ
ncbi:hypothetical protein ZWY2020_020826 [Hordeum vulgare]|nr:hypothetical protein ZWY2020_020826 [Hordeum vulgare]